MYDKQPLLRDILDITKTIPYLSVLPDGIRLPDGRIETAITARILSYGQARTLYRGRKPHCRSLDGIHAIQRKQCPQCHDAKHCTKQVRVDLLVDDSPHRLLLAYTSARNFLLYANGRTAEDLEKVETTITVTKRHSWGELLFTQTT